MLTFKVGSIAYRMKQYYLSSELPKAYMDRFFGQNEETAILLDDMILQVLFECSKYAYDATAPRSSLRQWMNKIDNIRDTDEEKRKRIERTFDKIKKYRKGQYDLYKQRFSIDISGLLVPDLLSMDQKKHGYELTELQYWEVKNVHDMELVTAIVDRRFSHKNLTVDKFIEYADQYDSTCRDILHEPLLGELVFFTLAGKYYFDFIYELALEMEKHGLKELDRIQKHVVHLLIGTFQIDSDLYLFWGNRLPQSILVESRLIHYRKKLIPYIVTMEDQALEDLGEYINEILMLISITRIRRKTDENQAFQDWFTKNTNEEDWASVFNEYNPFKAFVDNKEWSLSRVRLVRGLYNSLTIKAPR